MFFVQAAEAANAQDMPNLPNAALQISVASSAPASSPIVIYADTITDMERSFDVRGDSSVTDSRSVFLTDA